MSKKLPQTKISDVGSTLERENTIKGKSVPILSHNFAYTTTMLSEQKLI